jgi:uncharacterized membrane protein
MGLIIALLVIGAVLAILGFFVVKTLLWLAIVGVVLFVIAAVWGFIKGRTRGAAAR